MIITYEEDGEEFKLDYTDGIWTGGKGTIAAVLNLGISRVVGNHEYYRTNWHEGKAVADALGGTVDEDEPEEVDSDPNLVY